MEHCEQCADLTYYLKKHNQQYVLTITGFPSQKAAKKYIAVIWSGLVWVLLNKGLSFQADTELQDIIYAKDPCEASKNLGLTTEGKVDGLIDSTRPAVYASDKIIRTSTVLPPLTVANITRAPDMFPLLLEGTSFPRASNLVTDNRLMLALELYSAYFTEHSANAKFLTLVIALEVLANDNDRRRRQVVLDLLDRWIEEIKQLLKQPNLHQDDQVSLKALQNELRLKKEDSIGSRIRALVHETLTTNGDNDADDITKEAGQVYKKRSKLVHKGTLPVSELQSATEDAKRILEQVLKARYLSTVN